MSIEEIMAQSQTPRTHSIWNALVNAGSNPVETGRILGAARKMELELKAANDRIKRLEEAIQERDKEWFQVIESILGFHPVSMTEALRIGIERIKKQKQRIKRLDEENNELRAEEARLLNTKGELERRIKRFMDAGDAMFPWSERVGQEFWNKAKEDKL